jgi:hypothetical protein
VAEKLKGIWKGEDSFVPPEEMVNAMMMLGFERGRIIEVLTETKGDYQRAIAILRT